MTRRAAALTIIGLLLGAGALRADTALVYATPKNLKENGFELISKARNNKTTEFVIIRNIKGIDGPGRAGYLTKLDEKSLGARVKLRETKDSLEFRFTLPDDEISMTRFVLWGQGARGEGVTFEFKLKDFRP